MPAIFGSQSEHLFRPAPLDIRRREKAGEVAPNNLICFVTLNSFGAGIPTDNLAPRVHHENGVVPDTVEEQLISFFAFPERLDHLAFGIVALGDPARSGGH